MPEQSTLDFAAAATRVAGVDEAGRGPLAGPVYAAAVILDPVRPIDGLCDSKTIDALAREKLAETVRGQALAWAVARAEVAEIDRINILQASLLAMQRAVAALDPGPDHALVDGNRCPHLSCPAEPVIKGDASVPAISAASILAKVERDLEMARLDERHPGYGFARNKGYPTPEHLHALERLGACEAHRRSFAPVARVLGILD